MLTVAIAVDAPLVGPDAAAVVSEACEEVIGPGRCPRADAVPRGAVAAWFAFVHADDGALSSVRIEFRDRAADGVLIEQRTLAFGGGEPLKARLVSIGTVIAALAAAREGSVAPVPRAADPAVPSIGEAPRQGAPGAAPPRPSLTSSFDAAGSGVPGFGSAPDRVGGFLRANLELDAPLLFTAGAEYTAHGGTPSFGWLTAFAGVGTRIAPRTSRFNLELRGAVVFALTDAWATVGGTRESASQSSWGGRIGATVLWRAWSRVGFIAGADGTLVTPRVAVAVGSGPASPTSAATCGFFIGLRVSP